MGIPSGKASHVPVGRESASSSVSSPWYAVASPRSAWARRCLQPRQMGARRRVWTMGRSGEIASLEVIEPLHAWLRLLVGKHGRFLEFIEGHALLIKLG